MARTPGSGRKAGTKNKVPSATQALAEVARGHTDQFMQTLVDIATNPKASSAARVSAAIAGLEFGHGKARQAVDLNGDLRLQLKSLSDEELQARLDELLLASGLVLVPAGSVS